MPEHITIPFNAQIYWEQRALENEKLTGPIMNAQYCHPSSLLIILAHFYQAVDSFVRCSHKGIKVEDLAVVLKTIRLWYIHPEDERYQNVQTTCSTVIEEIESLRAIFKGNKLSLPPEFFENTLAVVTIYQEQY